MAKPVDERQRSQLMRKEEDKWSYIMLKENVKPISSRGCNYSINIIAYHKAVIISSYW